MERARAIPSGASINAMMSALLGNRCLSDWI
jgi:hypothetical protein